MICTPPRGADDQGLASGGLRTTSYNLAALRAASLLQPLHDFRMVLENRIRLFGFGDD